MTTSAASATPPGATRLAGHFRAYGRDPLGFMLRCAREYGGIVPIRFGPRRALLISDPAAIEEVLVERQRDFHKSEAARRVGVVTGNGILISEGQTWRDHRRLVQPAFHHERLTRYAEIMVGETERTVAGWADGDIRDFHAEMVELTLRIVARALFSASIEPAQVAEVEAAAATLTDHFSSRFNSLRFFVPDLLPTPGNIRMRRAVAGLDRIVYRVIAERRRAARASDGGGGASDDLLAALLEARDTEGHTLGDREVRDEVMTLFLAGHETTALTLTFAFHLLAGRPEAEAALAAELDEVLPDRAATLDDVPRLRYAEAVVLESLRLYPPAYAISRQATRTTRIGGREVRAGTIALISVWATHRDPGRFESPDGFRPERWLDGLARRLPRGGYLPFGEGPRKCVGAAFAMQEAILLLATIARAYTFQSLPGEALELRPAITLRPACGLRMRLRARRPGAGPQT